jgi:hypothetical protein
MALDEVNELELAEAKVSKFRMNKSKSKLKGRVWLVWMKFAHLKGEYFAWTHKNGFMKY